MDDTVCAGSNSGTLSLTGQTGTIEHWESSTDGGLTWITLANTTASQTYMNLTVTTTYRVFVQSGVCSGATSNAVTITVNPLAVGGTLNGSAVVCDTINFHKASSKVKVLSVAELFAVAIRNMHENKSITSLFVHSNRKDR